MNTPRRHRALLVATVAIALATTSVLVLVVLDRLNDVRWLAGALLLNAVGDVLAAMAAQLSAPTRIRLRPGEVADPVVEVVGGFGPSRDGLVRSGGETWRARLLSGSGAVAPGDRVSVVDREGLLLIVTTPDRRPTDSR